MSQAPTIDAYLQFFETLAPASLDQLAAVYTEDARFADPFSDVRGVEAIRRVFEHMFEYAPDARFTVHDSAWSGERWFLYWTMEFTGRGGQPWRITGTSRVAINDDGRVIEHLDYWDSGQQFYGRLPVLGAVIRAIRRRMA